MASWDSPSVAPPGGASYAQGLMDFSPIGNLANDFYKGAENKRQYDTARTFSGGLPRDAAGNIDFNRAAEMLAVKGDASQLVPLANADLSRKFLTSAVSDSKTAFPTDPTAQGGAQPVGDASEPRGIRNNNPGNIENGQFAARQPGYTGAESKGRFATFETPQAGIAAANNLLGVYGQQGINTIAGVINRWAPPSDKNDTTSYANTVAAKIGLAPDEPIDLADPKMRAKLSRAMFVVENGRDVVGGAALAAKPAIPPTGVPKGSPDGVPPGPPPGATVRVAGPGAPPAATAGQPQPPPNAAEAPPAAQPAPVAAAPISQPAPQGGAMPPALRAIIPPQFNDPMQYVNFLRQKQASYEAAGLAGIKGADGAAKAYGAQADKVMDQVGKFYELTGEQKNAAASGGLNPLQFENAKIVAKVAAENNASTPEQKLYTQAVDQGFKGTEMDFHAAREAIKGSNFKVIGKDIATGNDVHGFIDPATRKVFDINGKPIDTSKLAGYADGNNASVTGDAYLQTLDPGRANQVKAIAEGRMAPPGGMALKSPQIQALMRDVAQYEPGFDLTSWTARNKTRADLASGKMGQNVSSFNTAIGHLATLDKAAEALNNYNFTPFNSVANLIKSKTGDPAIKNFEIARTAVADELTRAFRGSGGNVHDLVQWESAINAAGSPAQLKAAIKQAVDLLHSRIEAVGDQYNRGMGKTTDPLELLSPKAKASILKLEGRAEPEATRPTVDRSAIERAKADPQGTLAEARAAIAAGKSREGVIEKLREYGVDPSGL